MHFSINCRKCFFGVFLVKVTSLIMISESIPEAIMQVQVMTLAPSTMLDRLADMFGSWANPFFVDTFPHFDNLGSRDFVAHLCISLWILILTFDSYLKKKKKPFSTVIFSTVKSASKIYCHLKKSIISWSIIAPSPAQQLGS